MQSNQLKIDPESTFKNQDKKFAKIFGMSPQDYAIDIQEKFQNLELSPSIPEDIQQIISGLPLNTELKKQDKKFTKLFGMSSDDYAVDLLKKMKALEPLLSQQKDFISSIVESSPFEYNHSENAGIALAAGQSQITARAFWWGFHIEISDSALKALLEAGDITKLILGTGTLGQLIAVYGFGVAGVPHIAAMVTILALTLLVYGYALKTMNQGKGVYLSWSWLQVAYIPIMPWAVLPVPTPVT